MGKLGMIGGFAVAICVFLIAFCTNAAFGDTFVFDFDNSFEGWEWQWDIWEDADYIVPGEVTLSDVHGYNDDVSLKFDMGNGAGDNGTLWIEKAFTISANTPTEVSVSFQLWNDFYNPVNRFIVTGCISDLNPEVQDDFTFIGETNTAYGWVQHGYQQTVTSSSGQVWVGVGIGVAWEGPFTYWIDSVEVSGVLPEPATLSILTFGGLAMLKCKRKF